MPKPVKFIPKRKDAPVAAPASAKGKGASPVSPTEAIPRTREQKEIDKFEMIRLLRRGWSRSMVAEKFAVPISQINSDWGAVVKDLREDRDEDVVNLIAIKLQEYAEVKREAWEAWDRSKQDAVENRVENTQDLVRGDPRESPNGEPISAKVKKGKVTRRQCGDPRFLEKIINCLAAERELLALNPVKRFEFEGHVVNWDVLIQAVPQGALPDTVEEQLRQFSLEHQEALGVIQGVVVDRGDERGDS